MQLRMLKTGRLTGLFLFLSAPRVIFSTISVFWGFAFFFLARKS